MRNLTILIVALVTASVLAACNGASPTPAAPSPITLTTQPDPPVMGPVELLIDVKDAQGQPLGRASVLVLVSHTSMSGMSGEWLVTVQVRKDDLNIAQDFRVEVQ